MAVLIGSTAALGAVAPGAGAAGLPTLSVTLGKGSIAVAGSTVSGGVNVLVTSSKGLKEPAAILFRLGPGVTAAELEAGIKKASHDPNNADPYGTIVFDAEGVPGGTSEAQTTLSPGNYAALEIEGEGGPKAKATFTVTAAPAPAALSAPAAVERTIDFGFKGPTTLHDGELVRFENEGFLVHMDIAFPTKSRSTALLAAHDLLLGREKAIEKLIAGPPVGFYGPLGHGGFQQETITAKPGWYVQACFMQTQDGRDHTLLGMERVIHIVK
ncbi:MAG: hypothetical protein ACLQBB_16285 [Solirubrobacteraceae bacterium]